MRIGIFVYDHCMYSTAVGLCDMFDVANRLSLRYQITQTQTPKFETQVFSLDGSDITVGNGRTARPDGALNGVSALDVLIVPGIVDSTATSNIPTLSSTLKSLQKRGTLICSVCAGSFFLAESGILDGKKATTHWHLIEGFTDRFPMVRWVRNQMLVRDGDIITTGGVSSWQELGLFIIAMFGSTKLTKYTSSFMLIEPGRDSQAPYRISMLPKSHTDEQIRMLQTWIETNFTKDICLNDMIDEVGMSERNLIRRFKQATGYTPLKYVQEQRLNAAKELLENTQRSFEEITWMVGYGDVNSFRHLFQKRNGMNPGAYRKRFSLVATCNS